MTFAHATLLALTLSALFATAQASESDETVFREKVAPILQSRCVRCHGGDSKKGGLSLATLAEAREGGDSLPAIEPGKPDESYLIDMIAGDDPLMPKGGKPLSPEEVSVLRRWIAEGAPWPEGLTLKEPKDDPASWWAFQPLTLPEVPPVKDAGLGPHADRRVHPVGAGRKGAGTPSRGGPPHLDPPPLLRPDGLAADAGRDRRLRERSLGERLRPTPGTAARLPPLRRALGAALARRRALRRHARLRQGQTPAQRLAVPRLRHREPER